MNSNVTALLIAVALFVLIVFLGRYELVGVPAGGEGNLGTAYRLDRWTGDVTFMAGGRGVSVEVK